MQLVTVESSMIHAVGYDPETRKMEVVFNSGKTYVYDNVPQREYAALLSAESKGQYMLAYIIDAYPSYKLSQRRGR